MKTIFISVPGIQDPSRSDRLRHNLDLMKLCLVIQYTKPWVSSVALQEGEGHGHVPLPPVATAFVKQLLFIVLYCT